ncbi:MAG: hypothetical protein HZA92_00735 [Verrucomicrobia bacterium]|nr:hypothetical protein [Verrucomicrobiota bacterium]
MKHADNSLARLPALWLAGGWLSLALLSPLLAADKLEKLEKPAAAATQSVTGKWTYTLEVSFDTSLDFTAELKQDGESVTGSVTVQEVRTAIEKGRFKEGQLTFEIPREYGGTKFMSRYQGRLAGDTLKGKILSGTAPLERSYEWNAKRAKPAAKP